MCRMRDLLAALMLAGTFVSCSEQPAESSGDSASASVSDGAAGAASEETVPEETELKPDIPDMDLDGYTFRVLTRDTDHHRRVAIPR